MQEIDETDEDAAECAIPVPQSFNFNPDPEWQVFVQSLDGVILKIATKFCTADEDLRQDVMQEARVGLATVRPEDIKGFEPYVLGQITEAQWMKVLRSFCGNVIRNSILSCLESYPKGNWYQGRTRTIKDKVTGKTRKVHMPARFSSLDELTEDLGMQVDEHGKISWPDVPWDMLHHHIKHVRDDE